MNKTQKVLIDLIYEELVREYLILKEKTLSAICRYIFINERKNSGYNNLRLTVLGFSFISKHIKFYSFTLDDKKLGAKEFIWLERTQKYPYHYNENSNIFYTACPNLSMLLKLNNGNFDTIIKI